MRKALASHRRSPKPDFCANRRRLIREVFSARAMPRDVQIPSLVLSRSLTDCGLALPPDDFITWPTPGFAKVGYSAGGQGTGNPNISANGFPSRSTHFPSSASKRVRLL